MEELFMLLFVVDINVDVDNVDDDCDDCDNIIEWVWDFWEKEEERKEMITKGDFMGAFWELFITYFQLVVTIEQKTTTTMPPLKRHNNEDKLQNIHTRSRVGSINCLNY